MLSGLLRSSGSSGRLRSQGVTRNEQNSVSGELGNELLGICQGLFGTDVKLLADAVADNFSQRSVAVGGLKDDGCDLVQREKRRIGRVHDHHFAGQRAGGNGRAARNVNAIFRHARAPPGSCGFLPTPWHQDRTSGGEQEPWRRNRKLWRKAFRPDAGLRRRTEYCASGDARRPWTTTHRCGSPAPAPEKTERRPGLCSSHPTWPALRRKEYRTPSTR